MKVRQHHSNVALEIVIVVAIIVFANLLSLRFFARADLTEGRLYSISSSTKEVLRNLDDVVNIKVYFSKQLPPYLATLTREVRDILDEYGAYAGSELVVDFEDPADDPEVEQRVRMLGIPQVQLNIIEKDKAEVMNGYLGMAILFADRSEVIPVVQSPRNLEYDLTSAILKVTASEDLSVGFLLPEGGPGLDGGYDLVKEALERQYRVETVNTSGGAAVPDGINTLVVGSPRAMTPWDNFAIDQFIMRGGKALFLIEMLEVPEGSLSAVKVDTGLDSLLAHYGITVNADMVVDRSCGSATFSTGFIRYTLPYMLWPLVQKSGFDQDSPITNQLELAVFPWTSSLEVEAGEEGAVDVTVLARSSATSWTEEGRFDLNPRRNFAPVPPVEPRDLAVVASGSFESYFASRPVPAPEGGGPGWEGQRALRSPETQIVVVGNSRFIETDFMRQYPENQIFFLNVIDWLTLGDSLIGIRSRAVTTRPLKEIGEQAKSVTRFASTFGVPLLLIIWGLLRRHMRRNRPVFL
jgi:gliding-associated putative ABC transporter substrate-binding component GldG